MQISNEPLIIEGEYQPIDGDGISICRYHAEQMLRLRGHLLAIFSMVENQSGHWRWKAKTLATTKE